MAENKKKIVSNDKSDPNNSAMEKEKLKRLISKGEGADADLNQRMKKEIYKLLRSLRNIDYVVPEEIPDIDLYMDQVTTFMDTHLESSKRFKDDKILTKTMINNYTKNDILPPPQKKKYSSDHLVLLLFIYYLKNFLSIGDISTILGPIEENYLGDKGDISLKEIYSRVVDLASSNMNSQVKDMINKIRSSIESFDDLPQGAEREELEKFMFVCMLSFDISVKKNLIENIIDNSYGEKKDE
ncbi:MAG: DUF1836 domain-containing protein [Lachnospiraceae bacterium]|jgi:hypothetical protein|nr:DUF1836 domain-containing protein [Lachnospiraceae bacterium]MEE3460716.1 DUF1836 domain-containing protein [Lachnospiraceae bacterium]